jgi:hypothetical protein
MSWPGKPERGAVTFCGFQCYRTTMFLHNLLYQRKAYAGIAAIINYRQCLKHHENLVVIFRRDAGAIICHGKFKILTLILQRNAYMAMLIPGVLDAVTNQVGEYLVKV